MIIDSHTHIWNVRYAQLGKDPFTAEDLIKHMDGPITVDGKRLRVDCALAQPRPTPDGTPADDWHKYVIESVAKHPDRLMGCAIVNPMRDLDRSLTFVEDMVKNKGFKAIKLHPTVQRYRPDDANIRKQLLSKVFDLVTKLRIPVLIHTGDPVFGEPSRMTPIIEEYSEHPVILCHFGTQNISYASDAVYVAKKNPNVSLETEPGYQPRLKEAIQELGADRFVMGTDCPVADQWSAMTRIYSFKPAPPLGAGLSQEDVDKILGLNLARLLGLRTST